MENIPVIVVLLFMTVALLLTLIIGKKHNTQFIVNYKYSILTVLIYNIILLLNQWISIQYLSVAFDNILPVIGLFLFRNIYVEFYRLLNKKESNTIMVIFVRVVPYILVFVMAIAYLQFLMNPNEELIVPDAFHFIVVLSVVVYQSLVLLDLFVLNVKLRRATLEKYHHAFRSNMLAIIVYWIVLYINLFLGSLVANMLISGLVYTIGVGFCLVNHITEETLYESKVFQKKIVQLQEDIKKPHDANIKDALTGVYNREYFIRYIRTFDKDDETLSVVVMQLSGLKLINGSYGYEFGDEVLQEILVIIDKIFAGATIARISGSEFAILQTGLKDAEIEEQIEMSRNICSNKDGFIVDVHFGYAIRGKSHLLLFELFKHAEVDLYDKRLSANRERQGEIATMLCNNFGVKLPNLSGHLKRCGKMAEAFGRYMGYDESLIAKCQQAALLHDIGLTMMPFIVEYEVTFKNNYEKRSYRNHPARGYDIITESGIRSDVAKGILHHHEHYDGKGYPDGLAGDDIPLISQIVALVDFYDMVVHYSKKEHDVEYLLKMKAGLVFSPELVDNMIGFLNSKQ